MSCTEHQEHVQPFQFWLESIALACFLAPRRATLHSPALVWDPRPSSAQARGRGQSWHTLAKRQQDKGHTVRLEKAFSIVPPPLQKQTRQLTALGSLLHSPLSKALARQPSVPPLLCWAHAASPGPSCPLSRRSLTSFTLSLFIFFLLPF